MTPGDNRYTQSVCRPVCQVQSEYAVRGPGHLGIQVTVEVCSTATAGETDRHLVTLRCSGV